MSPSNTKKWNQSLFPSETTWFRVTAWRRLAEICNEYLKKGRQVYVEGRMIVDENGGPRVWTGQDGQPRVSLEVNASSVLFLGNGGNGASEEEAPAEFEADSIPF